jgi:hypothetical protein
VTAGRDAIIAGRDVIINDHPPRQRYRSPALMGWGLFVAALAAIAVSIVFQAGESSSGSVLSPSGPGRATPAVTVAITSWEEQSLTTGGVRYIFHGTLTGQAQEIYVILQEGPPTASAAAARPWSVSPPARWSGDRWTVVWDLPAEPVDARWTAVAMADITCGGAGIECSPAASQSPATPVASSTVLPARNPEDISGPAACKWAYPGQASGQVSGSGYSMVCLGKNGQPLGGFSGAHSLSAWCADLRHTNRMVLPDPELLNGRWVCTG